MVTTAIVTAPCDGCSSPAAAPRMRGDRGRGRVLIGAARVPHRTVGPDHRSARGAATSTRAAGPRRRGGPAGGCRPRSVAGPPAAVQPAAGRRRPSGRRPVAPGALGAVGQLGPELQDGLGVDLADPALGHTEDVADLGQGQTFVVVEREDRLLPFAHLADGLDEGLLGLLDLEGVHRAGRGVGEGVTRAWSGRSGRPHGTPRRGRPPPRTRSCGGWSGTPSSVISRSAATSASVGVRCRVRLELGVRLLDGPGLGPHRPGHPVDGARARR